MSNPNEQVTEATGRAIDILSRIKDSIVSMQRDATAGNATWPQAGTMNKALELLTEVETFVWQKPTFQIVKKAIPEENLTDIPTIASDRDATIKEIATRLKNRTGKSWSVRGGKGTSWGWIKINAKPSSCTWAHREKTDGTQGFDYVDTGTALGYMSPEDAATLKMVLGLDRVDYQGISIPASSCYRAEYIARARYGEPLKFKGEPYWD